MRRAWLTLCELAVIQVNVTDELTAPTWDSKTVKILSTSMVWSGIACKSRRDGKLIVYLGISS